MIVYGCAVTDRDVFERCAEPGLRRAVDADPEAELLAFASGGSIFRNYNLIREQIAGRADLEALVLVHQDAEIVDPEFGAKLRRALADPEVAIVGCAGAVGVRGIAWWEGAVTWASFTHRYEEMGGGEFPGLSWLADATPAWARTGEVEAVDGFVLGLSPWAVRELRFDESLGRLHGYDVDICLQARAAGRKVVTENLRVVHHHSLKLLEDVEAWVAAHVAIAEKWEPSGLLGPTPGEDAGEWRRRARRAEAEAAAARLLAGSARLERDAKTLELEGQLATFKRSASWRLSAPVRIAGRILRRRRRSGAGRGG